MNGEYKMPWGVYKGKKIKDVPASYFLHLYNTNKARDLVKTYIMNNLEEIKKATRGNSKVNPA